MKQLEEIVKDEVVSTPVLHKGFISTEADWGHYILSLLRLCPPQPPPVDIADDIPTRGQGETRSKSLSAFDKTSLDILLMIIPSNEDRGHCVYDKVICPLEPPQPPPAEVEDLILKSAATTRLLAEAPCVQLDPVLVI